MCQRMYRYILMSVLLIGTCGLLFPWYEPSSADLPNPERELGPWAQGLKVGPGMDASGRILRGCVFVGLDLRNANFDGAHLGGCKIQDCNLRHASFKGAILNGLVWSECDITNADFTDAVINGYVEMFEDGGNQIDFTAAQFMSTRSYKTKDLSNCTVKIALVNDMRVPYEFDFQGANLRDANFYHCDLRESDFTDARIDHLDISYSRITGSQIMSVKNFRHLNGVYFGKVYGAVDCSGCDLRGCTNIPSQADITDAMIQNCSFRAPISAEQLRSTKSYKEGQFTGISFYSQDLSGVDLSSQDLSGCYFRDCIFIGADFEDAVISNTWFSRFHEEDVSLTVQQVKVTWNYKNNRMAGIDLPEELAAALEAEEGMKENQD